MLTSIAAHQKYTGIRGKTFFCCLLTFFLLAVFALPARADYETPPVLQAKSILKPEVLKGKYHTVNDRVRNDGLFNHYTVTSKFGTFQADSTRDLEILVNEIAAIGAMKQVETDDVALASLKQSGENTVTGLKNLFNDPQATLEGAASGVGSLFNRAKETVGKRETGDAEDSRFEQFVGISKSKGIIATRYGVNVYSRNKVLQEELDRLGQADYLGGLGVGVASSFVPGVGGLILSTSGTARLLNEAINTTPGSELWLQNKKKLLAMGVNADIVELFLNNPSFSPAQATVLVTAMESMQGVDNRSLMVKVALQAADPGMARVITRIATMTAGYNKNVAPLKKIAALGRLTEGVRKDGTRVILLPTDYLTRNKRVADGAAAAEGVTRKSSELWLLGTLSKRAATEFQQAGWTVHTDTGSRLVAAGK